jgi:hypothetical protein
MVFGSLVKAKVLAIVLASVAVVGGGTAVFAATPAGQQAWHAVTGKANSAKTPDADQGQNGNGKNCAGDNSAKQMLASFSLSTDAQSDAMQAVCELHAGQFAGQTPSGEDVSTTRVYGYGEIEKLLTYANYLATHDSATNNPSGKMDDTNARAYLAQALQSCGSTPLEQCLMNNIPGYQPGNGDNSNSGNSNGNGNGGNGNNNAGNGNGNGNGKPDGTPTPHH